MKELLSKYYSYRGLKKMQKEWDRLKNLKQGYLLFEKGEGREEVKKVLKSALSDFERAIKLNPNNYEAKKQQIIIQGLLKVNKN